jgi:hypothetical protein
MTNDQNKRKVQSRKAPAEREEPQQPIRRFISSLIQAGVSLATIPVNMLPEEPRGHIQAAGRELTRGLAALTRELAESLEKAAEEPKEQTG